MILIYTTHKNLPAAKKAAIHLLKKRLIACANFWPMASAYVWQGKIKTGQEAVCLLKTKNKNWRKVKKEIEKIHPDEAPCVICLPAEANKKFEDWINKEVR